jgi:hypothetical protein
LIDILPHRVIRVHTRGRRRDGGAWTGWNVWPGPDRGSRLSYYEKPLRAV